MMLCIESLVDRHYGLAVVFITPLTIFIAEYGSGLPLTSAAYQEVTRALARYVTWLYGWSWWRDCHAFNQSTAAVTTYGKLVTGALWLTVNF